MNKRIVVWLIVFAVAVFWIGCAADTDAKTETNAVSLPTLSGDSDGMSSQGGTAPAEYNPAGNENANPTDSVPTEEASNLTDPSENGDAANSEDTEPDHSATDPSEAATSPEPQETTGSSDHRDESETDSVDNPPVTEDLGDGEEPTRPIEVDTTYEETPEDITDVDVTTLETVDEYVVDYGEGSGIGGD